MMVATQHVLSAEILERCYQRAPLYDTENRFFTEDFQELRDAGYLLMAVPEEFGGLGMSLAGVCREQRRLAYYAHATALAINMHLYWTGVAADLWRAGDTSCTWILAEAAAGEVFAAGHAENGNDLPLFFSTTKAERVAGGYRFSGRKSFGSLSPVWTRFGLHGMDSSDPAHPKIVHAFLRRDADDYRIDHTWNVMGMRATCSEDTVLDGAFVPDRYVSRVVPAGAAGVDPFVLGIFAWSLLPFANIYFGLAQRALDLTLERIKKKTSLALSRSMAYHPEIQHAVAQMVIEMEGIAPHIDKAAEDWSTGVDHGVNWGLKIVSAKYRAVEAAWRVVDTALEVSGGFGIFKTSGLERLVRDARLGRIHPANAFVTHELVAKTALGIDLDETPRWG